MFCLENSNVEILESARRFVRGGGKYFFTLGNVFIDNGFIDNFLTNNWTSFTLHRKSYKK